jgi:glycosyltransferase involved in cell wall biosynthesis
MHMTGVDLSILVCSTNTRYNTFLPKILDQLFGQYALLSAQDQERVEILVLTDNKQMMLGTKRNELVRMAQGRYVQFVDDDDRVAEDFISALLEGTQSGADVLVFRAAVSLNGEPPKICYYSKDWGVDYNTADSYHRIPNHICCVKREVSLRSSFPNVLYGEDAGYSKVLLPHLRTQYAIDKVLYYYDYNAATTETQAWRAGRGAERPPVVDVVILSKANDFPTKRMTQKAVDTCFNGSNGLGVNILVIEGGGANGYHRATTLPPPAEKFNYNEYANYGASRGTAEWIMVANNDLVFHDGWLHYLLSAGNDLVSPHEPTDSRQAELTENTLGTVTGKHLSGWCFMIRRSLWEQIGGFDTDVDFWCSDDVVIEQCVRAGYKSMLVIDSLVTHTPSTTLRQEPDQAELTWKNVKIFNEKYGKHKFINHPEYRRYVQTH